MLLHSIYSTSQTCSKQLNSSACALGASKIAWGFIYDPIQQKLVDKGAAKISKFFFKRNSKLIFGSIGETGALRALRGAGAAVTGGLFDVIDMGIQIYNLVDCSNRPLTNRCSKKEIRDSIASIVFDGVSIVSTIACAALVVPGIGLAISVGILAIQLIYGGFSAVKEFHEKFRTTVGEDISIFLRTTLMVPMSDEIQAVQARQSFVDNAAKEMWNILQDENNTISTYAMGLGYILDENKIIPNGGKILLAKMRDMNEKVSRLIPPDKDNIKMICLPAPVMKNKKLREFEVEELLNNVESAKYYCDNAMVFENSTRKSDSVVFNLALLNAGYISGSHEKNNLFYIYDSNCNDNIVGRGIDKGDTWWSGFTINKNIVNGSKKDPFYQILDGLAEETPFDEITQKVYVDLFRYKGVDGIEEGTRNGKPPISVKAASRALTPEIELMDWVFANNFHIDQINLPNDTYSDGLFIVGGNSKVNQFNFVKHPFTAKISGGGNATNIIDCSEKCKSNELIRISNIYQINYDLCSIFFVF